MKSCTPDQINKIITCYVINCKWHSVSQLAIARPDIYTSALQAGQDKNTQETNCDQSQWGDKQGKKHYGYNVESPVVSNHFQGNKIHTIDRSTGECKCTLIKVTNTQSAFLFLGDSTGGYYIIIRIICIVVKVGCGLILITPHYRLSIIGSKYDEVVAWDGESFTHRLLNSAGHIEVLSSINWTVFFTASTETLVITKIVHNVHWEHRIIRRCHSEIEWQCSLTCEIKRLSWNTMSIVSTVQFKLARLSFGVDVICWWRARLWTFGTWSNKGYRYNCFRWNFLCTIDVNRQWLIPDLASTFRDFCLACIVQGHSIARGNPLMGSDCGVGTGEEDKESDSQTSNEHKRHY